MFDGVNLRDNVDMMTEIYSKVQIGPVLRQGQAPAKQGRKMKSRKTRPKYDVIERDGFQNLQKGVLMTAVFGFKHLT